MTAGRVADIQSWLRQILDPASDVKAIAEVGGGSGCVVARCRVETAVGGRDVHIKVYEEGMDDYSGLGPVDTARKHFLALVELEQFGLSVPQVVGMKASGDRAALVCETVERRDWAPSDRRKGAAMLKRLHQVRLSGLSQELQVLVMRSRPNRNRIARGVVEFAGTLDQARPDWRLSHRELAESAERILRSKEPTCPQPTLVHGDFFSKNLLAVDGGVVVIDWDLLAMGDPMWDLGHLMCADRCLSEGDRNEVLTVYGPGIDAANLRWHEAVWRTFWNLRDLLRRS